MLRITIGGTQNDVCSERAVMFLAVATRVLTLQAACLGTKPHYSPKVQGPQVSAHVPWAGSGESKIHQARPPALAHHHQLDLGLETQTAQPRQATHLCSRLNPTIASRHHGITASKHHDITTSRHQLIQQTNWIFEYHQSCLLKRDRSQATTNSSWSSGRMWALVAPSLPALALLVEALVP